MNVVEIIMVLRAILHTFVRFLPLGLYSFTYLSTALFKDRRSAILLLGLIINDVIGFLYKRYNKKEPNENCVIFGTNDNSQSLGFLPNPHTEYMAFVAAFFYSDMWYKYVLDFIPFFFILFLLVVTIWSRISIGCKTFKDVVFNLVFGGLRGIVYYYFVSSYYRDAERDSLERNTCDFGYNDYQCNEIKDGTVIMKQPKSKKPKSAEDEKNEVYQGWYD